MPSRSSCGGAEMGLRYIHSAHDVRPHSLSYGHMYAEHGIPATWVVEVFRWCQESFGKESNDRWRWSPSGVSATGRFEFVDIDDAMACRIRWG